MLVTLGWTFDYMDLAVFIFVFPAIMKAFSTSRIVVASILTATMWARLFGGSVGGWLADRYGRRSIVIDAIFWFSIFEGLTALSPNLALLYVIRILYGMGMGAMYAAGVPLAMEQVPASSRGLASGLINFAGPIGFILVSIMYATLSHWGWRLLFLVAPLPGIVIGIASHSWLSESHLYTARIPIGPASNERTRSVRLATRSNMWPLVHASLAMIAFVSLFYSINTWYPTFLETSKHFNASRVADMDIVLNVGAIVGTLVFGRLSDRIGRRLTLTLALVVSVLVSPWAFSPSTPIDLLRIGAFLEGFAAVGGAWSVNSAYMSEHFATTVRATSLGIAYHIGIALGGGLTPILIAALSIHSGYGSAIEIGVLLSAVILTLLVWIYPETKSTSLFDRDHVRLSEPSDLVVEP